MSKKCDKQALLIDVDPEWKKEWEGMPEYTRTDKRPFQQIIVNFKTKEDVKVFAKAINQNISFRTDSIWFPPCKIPLGIYKDES